MYSILSPFLKELIVSAMVVEVFVEVKISTSDMPEHSAKARKEQPGLRKMMLPLPLELFRINCEVK